MQEDDDPSPPEEHSVGGGPPPDPSTRAWRHPSEIAAAQAAARRDLQTPAPNRLSEHWSFGSFVAGGAMGALVTVAALVSTTSVFGRDDQTRVEFRTDAPAAAATPWVTTTLDSDGAGAEAGDDDDDEAEFETTSVPVVAGVQSDRWTRLTEPMAGVYSVFQLDGEMPLATGTLVDGILVTSASALGSAERVIIKHGGSTLEAVVRGSDEFSDLAVLVPVDDVFLGTGLTSDPAAITDGAAIHLVANDGQPQPIIVEGRLLAFDQRAVTRNGHTVLGTMHTSARVPELAAGAPLLDDQGRLMGMVIDSDNYLAFALPAARIADLAREIVDSGWPDPAWVGIEGTASEDGIVVTDFDEDGPAAHAGIAEGDLITAIDTTPLVDVADLVSAVRRAGPGATVQLRVVTDGQQWTARLIVGERQPRDNPVDNLSSGD